MINAYSQIVSYEEDNFQDFLDRLELIDIFMPVIKAYSDKQIAKAVIKYIVYCYSVNSEKVTQGDDWGRNKKRIFESCMFPPVSAPINYYNDMVHLQSEAVVASARKWIDFQDNDTFAELMMLKDLRFQLMVSATADIKNAAMEINYEQKHKNALHVVELNEIIKNTEARLLQNIPTFKGQSKEVHSAFSKQGKATLSIESMLGKTAV